MDKSEDINEWLRLIKQDLSVANHLQTTFNPVPVEHVCFHYQQATEKALKAVLKYHEQDYPNTHDIARLIKKCEPFTGDLGIERKIAKRMNAFAVEVRYLEHFDDWSMTDVLLAQRCATQVVDKVGAHIASHQSERQAIESYLSGDSAHQATIDFDSVKGRWL